jgi:hypothetical protein
MSSVRRDRVGSFERLQRALPVLIAAISPAVFAIGSVPDAINYQGVLRNNSNAALSGTFDMTFRYYSAEAGGEEFLIDRHLVAAGRGVTVSGGLFNVRLGTGELLDGSGPGTYSSLRQVFQASSLVWLSIQVGSETLSPRVQVSAAAYAFQSGDCDSVNGLSGTELLNTTSTAQTKTGRLFVDTRGQTGSVAITALGQAHGGLFENGDGSLQVYLASAGDGVYAWGTGHGGYFGNTTEPSLVAKLAVNSTGAGVDTEGTVYGVRAESPQTAGYFTNSISGAYTSIATANEGIAGRGTIQGGYFADLNGSASARIAYGDYGVYASGSVAGAYLFDSNSSAWAYVGEGTNKIRGNGAVSFVQNHPYDPSKVVVYHAPESSEVGTYTRGSARLQDGVAHVALDPTFAWVTNPDLGLTAHVTPRGEHDSLWVESISTSELIVRGTPGSNTAFDYVVSGLRLGFEQSSPVRIKDHDASIPSMAEHQALFAQHPELARFTAEAQFDQIHRTVFDTAPRESKASQELLAQVQNSIAPELPPRREEPSGPDPEVPQVVPEKVRPALPAGALWMQTETPLEIGDLVALTATRPGFVQRTDAHAARDVMGVVVATHTEDGQLLAGIAGTGFAVIKVDASFTPVAPGDLLIAAPTPGHAMRALDPPAGTVIGKAIRPLSVGRGRIDVLLMPR